MAVVFQKPKSLSNVPLHYCPGCPHGIIHRLVAEAIDELGIEGKTIGDTAGTRRSGSAEDGRAAQAARP